MLKEGYTYMITFFMALVGKEYNKFAQLLLHLSMRAECKQNRKASTL
jgi:hypothetical protein